MKRTTAVLSILVVFAVSCGADSTDVLEELGLSPAEADCFSNEYDSRGLDLDQVLRADEGDLSAEDQQAVVEVAGICAGASSTSSDDGDETSTPLGSEGSSDDSSDDGDNDERTYESLSLMEKAFADGMIGDGASPEAAVCILNEFDKAGISLLEFLNDGPDDEPGAEVMSAVFRCGDELADAGAFDFGGGSAGVAYGDNPQLDVLWDRCEAGDNEACDELYFISPVGSEYESFAGTCGDRSSGGAGFCSSDVGGAGGSDSAGANFGDDPTLDALYIGCGAGDLSACDSLYLESPFNSEYEAYGSTCGGVGDETFGNCLSAPASYGDDALLDALYDGCAGGSMDACDQLYIQSPFGSDYEAFGTSCGGVATEELFGGCADLFG